MMHFTDFFGVPREVVEEYGAFNISLLNDLPVFIDPFLLFDSPDPAYRQQHERMIRYVRFLRDRALAGAIRPDLLRYWFTFPEVRENWMGFCPEGNAGHGLGIGFARKLERQLRTIFRDFGEPNAIARGSHLEKLTLLQDRVGRDCISDMTMNLAKPFLLDYTQRFAKLHLKRTQRSVIAVPKVEFDYSNGTWTNARYELPVLHGRHIILAPKNILTREEVWISHADMVGDYDTLVDALPDAQLRAALNERLAKNLAADARPGEQRAQKRGAYEAFPALIDHYIRFKEDRGELARARSRSVVTATETVFNAQALQLRDLLRRFGFYRIDGNTLQGARERVAVLKRVVEENDGDRLFYLNGEKLKRAEDLIVLRRLLWLADVNRPADDIDISALVQFRFAARGDLREFVKKVKDSGPVVAIFAYNERELARAEEFVRMAPDRVKPNLVILDTRLQTGA